MLPLATALLTTSDGRPGVINAPPIGDCSVGAARVAPGVGALMPRCVIAIAVPATVRVAVRSAPVLAATVNWTVPLPLPVAPAVMLRNAALLVAVHAQPDPPVTATDPVPPSAANAVVAGWPAVTVHV